MDLTVPVGGVSFACAGVAGERAFVAVKDDGGTKRMLEAGDVANQGTK
jgi:hypothetical protein